MSRFFVWTLYIYGITKTLQNVRKSFFTSTEQHAFIWLFYKGTFNIQKMQQAKGSIKLWKLIQAASLFWNACYALLNWMDYAFYRVSWDINGSCAKAIKACNLKHWKLWLSKVTLTYDVDFKLTHTSYLTCQDINICILLFGCISIWSFFPAKKRFYFHFGRTLVKMAKIKSW